MIKKTYLIWTIIIVAALFLGGIICYSNYLSNAKINNNTTAQTDNSSQNINVSMEVGEKNETSVLKEGTTVYQFMEMLKGEEKISFSGKDYPNMGFFVEEINGVKNDSEKNLYWMYYVNDQPATEGISTRILKNGDKITWKLEKSNY